MIPVLIPDTNYLLEFPAVHEQQWPLRPVEIVICQTVVAELRGLTKNHDTRRASAARQALSTFSLFWQAVKVGQNSYQNGDVIVNFSPRPTEIPEPLDPQTPDHQLIALALQYQAVVPPRFSVLWTADRELGDIAETMGILVVSPSYRDNLSRSYDELARKCEWWEKAQAVRPKTEARKGRTTEERTHTRFQKLIRRLYGQARANRYRVIFSLVPLAARLGLALHVIQRIRRPEKRVALVMVESRAAADYWAGELRRLGHFSTEEVQVFGAENLEQLDKARAVIYRYDQVGRRLPQHLARLALAKRRPTAIVEGCDQLDPVDLAQLLFECDQFIGLNHHPLGRVPTPGNRMLNTFLSGHSLLSYSFADAERGGWGHPFDVFLHPVAFSPGQQPDWDEKNGNYVRLLERATRQHPELRETDDFWEALYRILLRTVSPEIGQLILLREEREQLAQRANSKADAIRQLLQLSPRPLYRRLIFDYQRQWTDDLLGALSPNGLKPAELPAGDGQRDVWDHFAGDKVDTLLLSQAPAPDLPGAHFHQLIILTPLRPLPEISATVDWALTHTQASDALRIDLLYVSHTPEELAMLELAESIFDLRFTLK
ncbi:MAG: PIN domain-containing protein [Chloroflexota bacterium]